MDASEETEPRPEAPVPPEDPGQFGPGLRKSPGVDPTLITSWIFILLGFTPYSWWQTLIGFGFFGPIEVPAILAMVGVLFGFIALLRATDLDDSTLRLWAGISTAIGMVRLFLMPFF